MSNNQANNGQTSNNQGPVKPQLTQEQIKQLMAMMQNQKPLPKYQQYIQKTMQVLGKLIQDSIVHMDNFIKFIVQKDEINKNDVVQSARGPILFGTYVIIIFVVFGGLWATLAPLDSASVAVGQVIPSSKRKTIQHYGGGTVKAIYVQVGDHVKEGDPIIELDEIQAKAQYETVLSQYRTVLSGESRLKAERDNLSEIVFDDFLLKDADDPQVATLMKTEKHLFESRREAYNKRLESAVQKHSQLNKQLEGLKARKISAKKNVDVYKERLKAANNLYEQGHISREKMQEIESREAQAQSEFLQTESEIGRVEQALVEDDANNLAFKNDYLAKEIIDQLNRYQSGINENREKYIAVKDGLEKIIIRSPVDGTVIELLPTTIGGVIGQGYPIAEILPTNDTLVIEARVPARTIDSVQVGLQAKIRFSAFKSRTTPVFNGVVTSLAPDIIQDKQGQQPQEPAYLARIEIDMVEFNRLAKKGKLVLRPGMQAEVQIVTGTRTLLRYLLDPVTDNFFKAFKEK